MAVSNPFIPNRDSEFDAWLQNFASLIAAGPGAYGLTAGDAAQLTAAYAAWHAAHTVAVAPETRTRPAIRAKDQARAAAVAVVRKIAAQVRADSAVSNELKIGLGLRVRAGGLSRVGAPSQQPALGLVGLSMGRHELVIMAADKSGGRAKPRGAAALLVLRTIAEGPTKNPDGAAFLTLATRARFTSAFTHADAGKVATYFARWANGKGELGPWSLPVSMQVAA